MPVVDLRVREVADFARDAPAFFFFVADAVDFFAFERPFAERVEERFFAAAIMPPFQFETRSVTRFLQS